MGHNLGTIGLPAGSVNSSQTMKVQRKNSTTHGHVSIPIPSTYSEAAMCGSVSSRSSRYFGEQPFGWKDPPLALHRDFEEDDWNLEKLRAREMRRPECILPFFLSSRFYGVLRHSSHQVADYKTAGNLDRTPSVDLSSRSQTPPCVSLLPYSCSQRLVSFSPDALSVPTKSRKERRYT
ncbi:hypothetical protein DFH06DRAFT_1176917, partial [Mycena polygramma]